MTKSSAALADGRLGFRADEIGLVKAKGALDNIAAKHAASNVTDDLALGFKISLEDAERLKLGAALSTGGRYLGFQSAYPVGIGFYDVAQFVDALVLRARRKTADLFSQLRQLRKVIIRRTHVQKFFGLFFDGFDDVWMRCYDGKLPLPALTGVMDCAQPRRRTSARVRSVNSADDRTPTTDSGSDHAHTTCAPDPAVSGNRGGDAPVAAADQLAL